MRVVPTEFDGLFVVESAPHRDERGYFHRIFDSEAFAVAGVDFILRQSGISHNARRGTLRGMHYQKAPAAQAKLVRCLTGALYDVVVDLRPESTHHMRWFNIELTAENCLGLYVPPGFAHGFISLVDNTAMLYELSAGERADCVRGLRWDDPICGIRWPITPTVINARDAAWPDYRPAG